MRCIQSLSFDKKNCTIYKFYVLQIVFNLVTFTQINVKKRKCNKDYLQYGFTNAIVNGQVVPQCVICYKKLSNDAMRPSRLKGHLETKHPGHQNKSLAFFESKQNSFKK